MRNASPGVLPLFVKHVGAEQVNQLLFVRAPRVDPYVAIYAGSTSTGTDALLFVVSVSGWTAVTVAVFVSVPLPRGFTAIVTMARSLAANSPREQ